MRELTGIERQIVNGIAIVFAMFFIYAIASTVPFYITRPIYVCACLVLVFCLYPATSRSPRQKITAVDYMLCAGSIGFTLFFMNAYSYYVMKPGLLRLQDLIVGTVALVLCVEACRRVLGWALPVLAAIAIAYVLWGNVLPGELGHRAFDYARIMGQIFSFEGIYGSVTGVYSTYVMLFIIFGAVIQATGIGIVLIDLSNALVGRYVGGTAKSAIFASGIIGSIMGSGAANVAVTGSFTIPLMKRAGYPAHLAGAFETVASAGGVLLPPVMGSAAFVLASFTGTPYRDIVLISILPGLLFYWAIYTQSHFISHKLAIPTAESEDSVLDVLKRGGHMLLPIGLILVLIYVGMTPYRAGLWTILAALLLHYIKPVTGKRLSPIEVLSTFGEGARLQLSVGASAGIIGIIIAALVLPGLPLKIASLATAISRDNLFFTLLLMILVSYVFGMGLPVVASYILLAVIAAPALTALGLPELTAHLIIMWFSLAALWTPPVAVGAFVASGIAQTSAMKIGWSSVRLGIGLYIIPFIMAYGTLVSFNFVPTVVSALFIAAALYCIAIALEGFSKHKLSSSERVLYLMLAAACLYQNYVIQGLALAGLMAKLAVDRYLNSRRQPEPVSSGAQSVKTGGG